MIDYRAPLDELPDPLPIEPLTRPFDVTITPPGSKSITCRAYVLAALADGESKIIRPLRAEDTDGLLDALCVLGAQARWDGEDVYIKGVAGRFPRGGEVNLGDGGTPTRFMIACACLAAEPVVVDGSKRMRERPIAEGVEMLRQLGARIEYVEEEGRLPVRVTPSDKFKGGELTIGKTASSQFISALMLIGSWLENGIRIENMGAITSRAYVVMTSRVLLDCVGEVRERAQSDDVWNNYGITIRHSIVEGFEYTIEPDASSALYWWCAAALVPFSRANVPHIGGNSPQPDVKALLAICDAGASSHHHADDWIEVKGKSKLRAIDADASQTPDGALALATMLASADGLSTITGLHTLRVKETDRIAALANELRKVGCDVETTDDSITITPMREAQPRAATVRERGSANDDEGGPLPHGRGSFPSDPVVIETYNDHRMAMAFAILGLVRPGISIRNPKCVAKSYPDFWRDFAKLYEN